MDAKSKSVQNLLEANHDEVLDDKLSDLLLKKYQIAAFDGNYKRDGLNVFDVDSLFDKETFRERLLKTIVGQPFLIVFNLGGAGKYCMESKAFKVGAEVNSVEAIKNVALEVKALQTKLLEDVKAAAIPSQTVVAKSVRSFYEELQQRERKPKERPRTA